MRITFHEGQRREREEDVPVGSYRASDSVPGINGQVCMEAGLYLVLSLCSHGHHHLLTAYQLVHDESEADGNI